MIASITGNLVNLMAPLGLVWLALITISAWKFRRREKREAWAIAGLVFFVWIFGATFVPGMILATLERPYAGFEIDRLPEADAIVLLGGGSVLGRYDSNLIELNESGDRVITALAVARRGKGRLLIIGGGAAEDGDRELLESENTKAWFLGETDITNRVEALPKCGNTRDEAMFVRKLAERETIHQILLVTSACHMRRAAAVFRTHLPGIQVHEVPCDFLTLAGRLGNHSVELVPTPGGFNKMSVYLHELVGWYYYRARGWIDSSAAAQKTPSFRQ